MSPSHRLPEGAAQTALTAYLTDVITSIVAGHPQSNIDDLLPRAYVPQPLRAVA